MDRSFEEEFLAVYDEIKSMSTRDEQNVYLVKKIGQIQQKRADSEALTPFENRLLNFYETEWDHHFLACICLRAVHNKRRHDWSKDYVYIFTLAGKFEFNVQAARFADNWLTEVNRHYFLEPHHVQHQNTGGVLHALDIEEMAIDQLCRSCEQNKGRVDREAQIQYRPKFKNDKSGKMIELFDQYTEKHEELVVRMYHQYLKK